MRSRSVVDVYVERESDHVDAFDEALLARCPEYASLRDESEELADLVYQVARAARAMGREEGRSEVAADLALYEAWVKAHRAVVS